MPAPPPLSEPAMIKAIGSGFTRLEASRSADRIPSELNFPVRLVVNIPTAAVCFVVVNELLVLFRNYVSVGKRNIGAAVMALR